MKLTSNFRWDTAEVEGSEGAFFMVFACKDREKETELRDEIIRRVNAHSTLRNSLELTTKTIEAIRPVLSLDYSAEGVELTQLLDVVTGEAKAALALAAASETRTEGTPDAKKGTQGKGGE